MGFLSIVRTLKRKEREIRLLILGLDNSGKTTILKSFLKEDVYAVEPTLGFQIRSLCYKNLKLSIWDIGGQKSLRAFWRNYIDETDGLIWVFDMSDIDRLEEAKENLAMVMQEQKLQSANILIFLNKMDLAGDQNVDKVKALFHDLLRKCRINFVLCSAINGINVNEGFDWIINQCGGSLYAVLPEVDSILR